jgi:hypothetical protein
MLENDGDFNIDLCSNDFTFSFKIDSETMFPVKSKLIGTPIVNFGIYNMKSSSFQHNEIKMDFDNAKFNFHSKTQSEQNIEFAEALESHVTNIYKSSWVYQYFNFKIGSENGIVAFYDTKKNLIDSYRFKVYIFIPKVTKPYFYSLNQWKEICPISECTLLTDVISNVSHGFKTTSYPSTKSVFYKLPYFLVFKSPTSISNNYLIFNNFLKPNFETRILAMLIFDEEKNLLVPYFSPGITLPFLKTLSLSKTLEFILVDSNKKKNFT